MKKAVDCGLWAERLGYLEQADEIKLLSEKTSKQLNALICALRNP